MRNCDREKLQIWQKMDKAIEKKFVKTFIVTRMQDRFLHELFMPEKRKKAALRFAHTAENYLKEECIYAKSDKFSVNDIAQEVKKVAPDAKQCYVIGGWRDGECMPLRQALEACFDNYTEPVMVVNDNLAFVKTETCVGAPQRYMLYKKITDNL